MPYYPINHDHPQYTTLYPRIVQYQVQPRVQNHRLPTYEHDPAKRGEGLAHVAVDDVEVAKEPPESIGQQAQSGDEKAPKIKAMAMLERGEDERNKLTCIVQG